VPVADATLKAVGDDRGGAFTFLEYVVSRGIPRHVHAREHETVYMLEGTVRVQVGDEEFTAGVGDFVFMPRGLPHS
jgi:quercetin dioxygenase-like cupin family protein